MEEKKPIRILQINAGSKKYGGVSAMTYEIYKNIDKTKFQFDFVSPEKTTFEIKREEIEKMGGRIFELDTKGNILKRKIELFVRLRKLIKQEKYQIIHINSGVFSYNLEVAIIAKLAHVKKIIIHSHSAGNPNRLAKKTIEKITKPFIKLFGTDFLTCSNEASKNMYTDKMIKSNEIITIPNGIETEKFEYNEKTRNEYRKTLNIENKIVLGTVGRLSEEKNQKFMIDILKELLKLNDNAILMLVGDGDIKQQLQEYVKKMDIEDKVLFLGLREDIENLLMCMDIFIMTSTYEGLPVVGIEAQASGLPVILSDVITQEVKLTDKVKYISLQESPEKWAQEINNIEIKENERKDAYKIIQERGFDIKETVRRTEEIYLK